MTLTILDLENGFSDKEFIKRGGEVSVWRDMGPFEPRNKLVSVAWTTDMAETITNLCFYHSNRLPDNGCFDQLRAVLDETTLLVGHHLAHELKWLKAIGLPYRGRCLDTEIMEYVLARGRKRELNLGAIAARRGARGKKKDLVAEYWDAGTSTEFIPWDILDEYGRGDIETTSDIYTSLVAEYKDPENSVLLPTVRMMCDFLHEVVEMEYNGLAINFEELHRLEGEFLDEQQRLNSRLFELAARAMGDTPIRFSSPDFRSELVFSRRVKDKSEWKKVFNIGLNDKGKPLRRPKMSQGVFNATVRGLTEVIQKTKAAQCPVCSGTGRIQKFKKDGTPFKNSSPCPEGCVEGVLYNPTGKVAGFKFIPRGVNDVAQAGFATDKDTLEALLPTAEGDAKEFVESFSRLNAIGTYLSTFVDGISKHVQGDGILHTNLNQTITSTGRLSSTAPNLHNQPRGKTFPIRRVFVSRFPDGSIIEADYKALEYRVAGGLSGCPEVARVVRENIDAHARTRDTINSFDNSLGQIDRQDAKPHTFKPLYGGSSGTPREQHYYKSFMEWHTGVREQHEKWKREAITTKRIRLPSGREYSFPFAKRLSTGYVQGTTEIVNWPVQGFATADLVPLGIIAVSRLLRARPDLRSVLILTVHDSVEVDCYPGEEEIMCKILKEGLCSVADMCKEYYNYEWTFPIDVEIKIGKNLLDMKEVHV